MTTDKNSDYVTFKAILDKCFRYRGSSRKRYLAELDEFIRGRTERWTDAMLKAASCALLEKQLSVEHMCNNALSSRIEKAHAENVILKAKQVLLVADLKTANLKLAEIAQDVPH